MPPTRAVAPAAPAAPADPVAPAGAPAPERTTRRRAATRTRLLDAAFAVFAARGFGQVRIEDVCEAAGYSRGAFYSNFTTLQELFFELYAARARAVTERVAAALPAVHEETTVSGVVGRVVAAFPVDREWELVRADVVLHAARHPDVARELAAHRRDLVAALAAALGPAVDRAGLPPALRSADALARAVVAVHDGVVAGLLVHADPERARAQLRDLLTALLDHAA